MKRSRSKFFSIITNRPDAFSLLEILIVFTGIATGAFLYYQTTQTFNEALNARNFDKDTRQLVVYVSIANIRFNQLLDGNSEIDIEDDIYSRLDMAEDLCLSIEQGGPGGQFIPTPEVQTSTQDERIQVCDLLLSFRSIMQQRWQDKLEGKPDSVRTAYDAAFMQFLETMQQFEAMADPHLEKAESSSRTANAGMSFGLTGVFIVIAIIIWRTRKLMNVKTKQLEAENELRTRLNTELYSERNLVNTLIDNLPDAVFAKDRELRFLVANPAAARIMGLSTKEELISKTSADFQPKDIAEQIQSEDTRIIETGEVLLNQQEMMMNVTTGDLHWRQTTKVPLRDQSKQIIGLVGISRDITKQRETEEALMQANEKLIQGMYALEQSTHETERLSEMVDLLQACPNTEEACRVISDQMIKFFPDVSGALYLFHASRNIIDKAAEWGQALDDPSVFKPEDCWGLRRGRMHIIEESSLSSTQSETSKALLCSHIVPHGPASYLCVPLVAQGESLGLMHLRHQVTEESDDPLEYFTHEKRRRIHTIIDSLSLALANLKLRSTLRQQSIRDPLTGMFNRRYMEETLEREIMRAMRSNQTVGVIMLDIDHFKQFNDTFGHQAGDALLTALGHFFLSSVRGEDVACRYGGEEFILLLPGSTLENACQRAEELREKTKYIKVTFQGQSLNTVTLSLGVAVFPQHGSTLELLVQAADQALYRAKMEGRDRVVVA